MIRYYLILFHVFYVILCCIIPCVLRYYGVLCLILFCDRMYYVMFFDFGPHDVALYRAIVYYIVLCYIFLCYIML